MVFSPFAKNSQAGLSSPGLMLGGLCVFLFYSLLGLSGYSNDADAYSMLVTGQQFWLHSVYEYSRPPGYLLPELTLGAASLIGGYPLANMISAGLATASLYVFFLLLNRAFAIKTALLISAVVAVNPYFMIAATSSMDYIYGLFFILAATLALTRYAFFLAALLFACGLASRLSNILIVGIVYAYFLYELYRVNDWRRLRHLFASGVLSAVTSILLFVPAYIAADYSFGFFTYTIGDWGFFEHFSRFVYKNIYLLGLLPWSFLILVLVFQVRRRMFRPSLIPLLFAGLTILLVHEAMFFKVPLEIAYLLPMLFVFFPMAAHWFCLSDRILSVFLVLTLCYGLVVKVDFLDRKYDATGREAIAADVGVYFRPGVLLSDLLARKQYQKKHMLILENDGVYLH